MDVGESKLDFAFALALALVLVLVFTTVPGGLATDPLGTTAARHDEWGANTPAKRTSG